MRKLGCEEARLLTGLPDVLLPERSVKCWGCVRSFMLLADHGRVLASTQPVPRARP